MKLIYTPMHESDPQETTVADRFHFKAGEVVELPAGWDHIARKLASNPWFKVVEDVPDPRVDNATQEMEADAH